jgi:hypothetical protein
MILGGLGIALFPIGIVFAGSCFVVNVLKDILYFVDSFFDVNDILGFVQMFDSPPKPEMGSSSAIGLGGRVAAAQGG